MAFESVRGYVELASGLSDLTRARAKEAALGLLSIPSAGITSGSKMAVQASSLADELLAAAAANRSNLTKLVRTEVDLAIARIGLVSAQQLQNAQAEAARLRAEVTRLRSASARTTAPTGTPKTAAPKTGAAKTVERPATKEPAAKKAVVKKAVVKKAVAKNPAAKKSVAKNPAAKKSAVKKPAAKKSAVKKAAAKKAAVPKNPASRAAPSNAPKKATVVAAKTATQAGAGRSGMTTRARPAGK